MVRKLKKTDWDKVSVIYIDGINTDLATRTLESDVKRLEDWIKSKIKESCLVFEKETEVLGRAENKRTFALHRKYGFRLFGTLTRIDKRNGVWRDTLLLERRSKKVGLD